MITKVNDDWLKAIREFNIEELVPEDQQEDFSKYLSGVVESDQDQIVIRFLMEDWKSSDTLCLLGYVWAIWKLDDDADILDIEILMPEKSCLDVPESVEGSQFFVVEGAISI